MSIRPQHKYVVMKMLEDLEHAATQTMIGSRLDCSQMSQQHWIKVEDGGHINVAMRGERTESHPKN